MFIENVHFQEPGVEVSLQRPTVTLVLDESVKFLFTNISFK